MTSFPKVAGVKKSKASKQEHIAILLSGVVLIAIGSISLYVGVTQTRAAYSSRIINLRMEDIGELVTQAAYFTNVQFISDSREIFGITVPFTQSRYVFSYDGVIRAGIDFSDIRYSISTENKTITVHMPKAYIMSTTVAEDSLEVTMSQRTFSRP